MARYYACVSFYFICFIFLVNCQEGHVSSSLRSKSVELAADLPFYLRQQSCPDTSKKTRVMRYGVCITSCIFHLPNIECNAVVENLVAETDDEIMTTYTEYLNYFCDSDAMILSKNFTYSKKCVNGSKYSLVSDESPSQFDVSAGGALN